MKISIANRRSAPYWENTEMSMEDFKQRLANPVRTQETVAQYQQMSKSARGDIKDIGGFVGGHLQDGKRCKGNALCRSLVTLDLDNCPADILLELKKLHFHAFIYSTHSHTPEHPRLRLVIPITREISEEEYEPLARMIAETSGLFDYLDGTTFEASRLMYWPSISSDGEYVFEEVEGECLNPDDYLNRYVDWRDKSSWPKAVAEIRHLVQKADKQEDPLNKEGIIGDFCCAFPMNECLELELADIYEPTEKPDRYTYIAGTSVGGLLVFENKFAYSFHGTDPARGRLCNAFDLIRIHKFGHLDTDKDSNAPTTQLPSFKAMVEYAKDNPYVREYLANDFAEFF